MNSFYQLQRKALRVVLFIILFGVMGIKDINAWGFFDFSAECSTGQTLYYYITDSTNREVCITHPEGATWNYWGGFSQPTGDIEIPESVMFGGVSYSVVGISDHAFYWCDELTGSLTIPNSITYIGDYAFQYCDGFTGSLIFGNSVTSIGNSAFSGCNGFTGSLTIPNSVTGIGKNAFYGCSGFTGSLTIGNSVATIGESAFQNCSGFSGSLILGNSLSYIWYYAFSGCNGFTGSLMIPGSVLCIAEGAFKDCSGFDGSLIIPNSVILIGRYAFMGCSGFDGSLIISNSLTDIDVSVFEGCEGFTGSLIIPNSVTSIGQRAFYACQGFTGSLTIPDSVTGIGKNAFYGCSGFTGSLTIPNSVTSIDVAFSGCSFNGLNVDLTDISFAYPSQNFLSVIGGNYTGSLTIGNSVKTIGISAFEDCDGFTGSLTIGNSVTSIGNSAFSGCNGFTGSLTIGDSVTSIGNYAFRGCSGLTGLLTIPNSVTSIGQDAFRGCSGFNGSLTIPNSVYSIGQYAFAGCSGFDGFLTISNAVTSIPDYAFIGCSGLTGLLTIPNSVTSIGQDAFRGCSGFNGSLTIPNSVYSIGQYAFAGCSGFDGFLTIPNTVTSIPDHAFSGCSGLTGSLTIPNSVTSIEYRAFEGCSGLTTLTWNAENVTSFNTSAFSNCSNLTTVVFGEQVQTIPSSAFAYCVGLTDVYWNAENVSNYPSYYNDNPFKNCSNLTTVVFGDQVQTIPAYAFYDCSSLTGSLTIPNSVTSIGQYAFYGCGGLTGSLIIGNSVTSIGNSAFYGCSGFTGSLTIPNSVTSIGGLSFYDCGGFTGSLIIPNSVTSIEYRAFEGCSGFTGSLIIGNSVTSIGNSAFYGCSGFTGSLTIPNSVTSIGGSSFYDCGGFTGSLTIPNSVISIGDNAFVGCSGFTGSLTIGNSVETIGNYAFSNCSSFSGPLTIGESVSSIGYSVFDGSDGFTTVNWNAIDASFSSSYSSPFSGWTNLSTVVFGNQVQTIPAYIFSGCSGLTGALTIPNSVNSIGYSAFYRCSGLNSVYYEGDIAQWCNISFGGYWSNPLYYAHNLYIDNELVTNLVIPEMVTEIKNYAFVGCSGFTGYLTIPNSVTAIGNSAFEGCSGFIGTLTIGNSLESIGSYAFSNCSGLKGVRIHSLTPPTIAQSSLNFNGADRSVPVFVPCGTQNDYKAAQYWSEFENINESPYNLVITSNDELGGEISVLEYADCEDNHCAILAVPNIGYNFLGWYVDDYFATITPFCDFTLTEDVTFEARFEMLPNHNVANGTSNLWSDPGTWFLGEVPTSTSSVGIWKDVIVDVDAEVTAVGIYDGSTITVKPGVTLTVTDTLGSTENSSIMIQDGGQLVHSNGEAKATIQKSIEPYTSDDDGWNLISFPLVGNGDLTTIGNMLSNQYDLYAYDEPTEVWKNQKYESNDFTSLEAGVGYLYANKGTATDIVPVGEQIGEGTSTIGYTPFYTYYKYSIAENLFLASELLTAGLSTTPIGALYWYATNETGYVQSNISIWMANVDDAELTTTSHNVSEMTLVYTGNMTPVTGWNPFVFNENSFAWDGVSNLLVCVQRNNGAWNSPIYWRAHNPGFDAVSYKYTDDNAYDMATETYSMSVTLLRPDTFFQTTDQVGQQSANYLPITMSFAGELENGTAEVTVPLSYTEGIGLAGFNLVGNPFVHNVTSYTGTNVADGCFRLNDTRDNLIVSEISVSNPLKPVEGFFVKATAAEASITFNHQTRGEKSKGGVINLELSADGKIIDRLLVRNDGDPLEKLSLGHSKARLFVVKGRQEMAAVPMEGNEQPICFKTAKTGTYTITVNLEGMELNYLYLIDHMTGANVNLLVEPSYSFEARNSDYESRFQLLYSPKEASGADDEQFAFISNGSIIIMGEYSNATLQIVDMTGRLAYSLNGRIQCVPTEGMASGAYVLRLINGNKVRTQKIVIK